MIHDLTLADRMCSSITGVAGFRRRRTTIETIIRVVARAAKFTPDELRGPSRYRPLVHARHVAMTLCREITTASLPEIGRAFSGRDHTTVINALRRTQERMGPGLREAMDTLRAQVEAERAGPGA